jgi:dihydroorotate dehydrogenase electron transfer subunit
MLAELPKTVRITARTVENDYDVTLRLGLNMDYAPGQFLMIWIPGIGEKPFSIAGEDSGELIITVLRRGTFSQKLADLAEGSLVGVRGPYGKGFELKQNCCLLAGGVGIASVAPIADRFPQAPILYGENTASKRIYKTRFPKASFYTMDGSAGTPGFPTDSLAAVIKRHNCEIVYCCGPEAMLLSAIKICHDLGVRCQAATERYMKCGQGVCGQCVCGKDLVCVDGPVFDGEYLLKNSDFGKRSLDASGAWIHE